MNYTPVVSLNIDPDETISKRKLGFHSGTFEQLVKDIKTLLGDEQLLCRMSQNSRSYTEKNHDIKEVVKKLLLFDRFYHRLIPTNSPPILRTNYSSISRINRVSL
jgi:hypothetical protein